MPIVVHRLPRWRLDAIDFLVFVVGAIAALAAAGAAGVSADYLAAALFVGGLVPIAIRRVVKRGAGALDEDDVQVVGTRSFGSILCLGLGTFVLLIGLLVTAGIALAARDLHQPPWTMAGYLLVPSPVVLLGVGLILLGIRLGKAR